MNGARLPAQCVATITSWCALPKYRRPLLVKEIGWGEMTVADTPEARACFGDLREFESFHWHGETFSIPEGAQRIAASEYCRQ